MRLLISAEHLSAPVDIHSVNLTRRSRKLCLLSCLYSCVYIVLEEYVGRNLDVHVLHVEPYPLPFGRLSVLDYCRLHIYFFIVRFLILVFEEERYCQWSCRCPHVLECLCQHFAEVWPKAVAVGTSAHLIIAHQLHVVEIIAPNCL